MIRYCIIQESEKNTKDIITHSLNKQFYQIQRNLLLSLDSDYPNAAHTFISEC